MKTPVMIAIIVIKKRTVAVKMTPAEMTPQPADSIDEE